MFFLILDVFLLRHGANYNSYSYLCCLQFIFVVAVTILMDIIQLGLYFDDGQDRYGDGDSERDCVYYIQFDLETGAVGNEI